MLSSGEYPKPKLPAPSASGSPEDLEEHPFVTLRERCDYVRAVSGVSVSRSTMWRVIARIGTIRKKGGVSPRSETSS